MGVGCVVGGIVGEGVVVCEGLGEVEGSGDGT